ncbi:hypothetical protein GGI07_000197, partial [Coemansia sp. Benny D115]
MLDPFPLLPEGASFSRFYGRVVSYLPLTSLPSRIKRRYRTSIKTRLRKRSSNSQQDKVPLDLLEVDDYDGRLERIRQTEYPQLYDSKSLKTSKPELQTVFLDHTGSTLFAASHVRAVADELLTNIPANPHSNHTGSQWTHKRVDHARDRLLAFFGTSSENYAIVFTANATAAIRLAGELTPMSKDGGLFCYTRESHTSVVGVRNIAGEQGVAVRAADFSEIENITLPENTRGTSLLVYPAQCNFSGERFSLDVTDKIKKAHKWTAENEEDSHMPWWVLLDAAGFASSSPLNLDSLATGPDFVAVSMYKIFGAPTGLGALLIKRSSIPFFNPKRYFGGGTVMNLSFDKKWQEFRHEVESRLEDGTINFQSIVSMHHALDAHARNFGSMDSVARHMSSIRQYAHKALSGLKHTNGQPMCNIYGHQEGAKFGAIFAFNLKDVNGKYIGFVEVERLAVMAKIALRTGRFCNPGAAQKWLNFTSKELMQYSLLGYSCGDDNDIINGKPMGALRISLGAVTNKEEIDLFVEFLDRHYKDYVVINDDKENKSASDNTHTEEERAVSVESESDDLTPVATETPTTSTVQVEVEKLLVYPIKSCHGYEVPRGVPWEFTPFGLKFDRSFMIMRQNDSTPMQQKRYPNMALIRPQIDTERSVLILNAPSHSPLEITLVTDMLNLERVESRVCGETMQIFRVISSEISAWLTSVLSVACFLACDPRLLMSSDPITPITDSTATSGSEKLFPRSTLPSRSAKRNNLSFANEAQLLIVTSESVQQVNQWITEDSAESKSADPSNIDPLQYRPNLVVKSAAANQESSPSDNVRELAPFEELEWKMINFGSLELRVSGPCRRCQMVGVNQESSEVKKEPFSTLSRKMRVNGKIVFGVYLNNNNNSDSADASSEAMSIQSGTLAQ